MVLQKVAEEGHLELTDTLIDDNNTSIKVTLNTALTLGVSNQPTGRWNATYMCTEKRFV